MEKLFSIASAAEVLSVSTFTIRRLVKSGALRSVRVSERVLIPASEIEHVIQDGCARKTAPNSQTVEVIPAASRR